MTSQAESFSNPSIEIPDDMSTALQIHPAEQCQQALKQQRVFGQYTGRISTSANFDDPLPDSFWLGET